MARSANNINAVFTDVAKVIREKTGGSSSIIPRDFADQIASIPVPEGNYTITQNGEYNISQYATTTVQVEGERHAQLYPALNYSYNKRTDILMASKNPKNGEFINHFYFAINNELLYTGDNGTITDLYSYFTSGGQKDITVYLTGQGFENSVTQHITMNIIDYGGYILYLWDGYHTAAKFLKSYSMEENEYGETVVINN